MTDNITSFEFKPSSIFDVYFYLYCLQGWYLTIWNIFIVTYHCLCPRKRTVFVQESVNKTFISKCQL